MGDVRVRCCGWRASEIKVSIGSEGNGRPVGEVVDRNDTANGSVGHLGVRLASRKRFIAPHSSASRSPNVTQRKRSRGMSEAMASEIPGNKPWGPVWKMGGLVGIGT